MVTFNMCSKSNLDLGWVAHESYNNVNRASWYSYLRKWRTGCANMPLRLQASCRFRYSNYPFIILNWSSAGVPVKSHRVDLRQ